MSISESLLQLPLMLLCVILLTVFTEYVKLGVWSPDPDWFQLMRRGYPHYLFLEDPNPQDPI